MKKLSDLFAVCAWEIGQKEGYDVIGNDVNYKFIDEDNTLYIYFQGSKDLSKKGAFWDWFRNFWFFPKWRRPYKEMRIPFKVHGGFLAAWKEVEDLVKEKILAKIPGTNEFRYKDIVIVGYSHGGALSGLCYEMAQYWRNDIKDNIIGFGFESPRFLHCWSVPNKIKDRWNKYYVIRNNNDIVTKCPPWLFKFCHVGKLIKLKTDTKSYAKPKCIGAHQPSMVYESLLEYENKYGKDFYLK